MNLDDEIAKQDAERDMDDETKKIELRPCTKANKVKKAFQYKTTFNPCANCNHYGIYTMFGHEYKCDEYGIE